MYIDLGSAGLCRVEGIKSVFKEDSQIEVAGNHWYSWPRFEVYPVIAIAYDNEVDVFEFIYSDPTERDNMYEKLKSYFRPKTPDIKTDGEKQ